MANHNMDEGPLRTKPETDPNNRTESPLLHRPFGVTLLLLLVLSLSAWGLLRLTGALRWWDVLYEKGSRLSPLYLSITGTGWAIVGIVILWSLGSIRPWSRWAVSIATLAWLAEYWLERIFFQALRSNTIFSILASFLLIVVILASAFNRKTNTFMTKSEEHEQPEEHSKST